MAKEIDNNRSRVLKVFHLVTITPVFVIIIRPH